MAAPAVDDVTTNLSVALRQPSPANTPTTPSGNVSLTAEIPRTLLHPQQTVFLAPPPPPPPPPPDGLPLPSPLTSQDKGFTAYESLPGRHTSAEALANEHEQLRDFGDQVVGFRFRLAAKRKQLRDLRFQTGVKDGVVFNLLRQYLQENEIAIPTKIEDALDGASNLRDTLGPLEAEYDNDEADYNALEWSYTDKETRFVEEIVDRGFVAGGNSEQRHGHVSMPHDDDVLTRLTSGHLDALNDAMPEDLMQSEDPCGQLIESLGLERELFDEEKSALRQVRILDSVHSTATSSSGHTRRDIAKDQFLSHLYNKMRRVNAWLIQIIEASPLQKAQLNAELGLDGDIDEDTWRKFVKEALVQNGRTAVMPTIEIAGQRQQANEDATACLKHERQSGAFATRHESIVSTLPERIEPRTFEQNKIQNIVRVDGHPDNGGATVPADSHTASNTIGNGRDSCSSQTNSRRTSYSDDIIAGSEATSHRSCACEKCAHSSARPPDSPTLESELRHDTASVPTTPTQRDQDKQDLNTPHQPLDLGKPSHEEGDVKTIQLAGRKNNTVPRQSKEQYIDRFMLPPSDLATEPRKISHDHSTAPSPPMQQCQMHRTESTNFSTSLDVGLNTPSYEKSASTSNPFSSGCLVM
ncbi:unnamed protein product [Alternaria alternata]